MIKLTLVFISIFAFLNTYSQDVLLESFKSKTFNESLKVRIQKGNLVLGKAPAANVNFSNLGYDDNSALRVSIKYKSEPQNARVSLSEFSLTKKKMYKISYLVKSRTGSGKIRTTIFSRVEQQTKSDKQPKYKYHRLCSNTQNFKSDGSWQEKNFIFEVSKKNDNGQTLNLNDLEFNINFSQLERSIYLVDNIKITKVDN